MGKSIQIVISGMGLKLGTDASMGTPWLIMVMSPLALSKNARLLYHLKVLFGIRFRNFSHKKLLWLCYQANYLDVGNNL